MPCDAVATVWVHVGAGVLETLQVPQFREALMAYLRQKVYAGSEVTVAIANANSVILRVAAEGVTVEATAEGFWLTGELRQSVAAQVQEFCRQLTGLYAQQKARAAIRRCLPVTEELKAPGGAIVLRVSL